MTDVGRCTLGEGVWGGSGSSRDRGSSPLVTECFVDGGISPLVTEFFVGGSLAGEVGTSLLLGAFLDTCSPCSWAGASSPSSFVSTCSPWAGEVNVDSPCS